MLLLNFTIPDGANISPEITNYTDHERYLILTLGIRFYQIIKETHLNENEEIQKIKNELNDENNKKITEMEISIQTIKLLYEELIEKEITREKKNNEEKMQIIKENIEVLKNENKGLNVLIKELELKNVKNEEQHKYNDKTIENEVMKVQTEYIKKYEDLKSKNNDLTQTIITLSLENEKNKNEENIKMINDLKTNFEEYKLKTCSSKIGQVGENYLYEFLISVFEGYEDFEIINTTKKPHSGDFLLNFKEFSILVDCKNFITKSGVSTVDINKLKNDVKQNPNIKIAWMISLDKPILRYNDAPFVIKIENGVCYCYINSLKNVNNSEELINSCWWSCKEIYTILNKEDDMEELKKLKKNSNKIKNIAEKMKKRLKESQQLFQQFKKMHEEQEDNINEILSDEILNIKEIYKEIVLTWWNEVFVRDEGKNNKIKTNYIYEIFKENKPEVNMCVDKFKLILKDILNEKDIIVGKSEKAQYQIINYKLLTK